MIKTGRDDFERTPRVPASSDRHVLVDREHLLAFAMGDRLLERRFLRLFIEHAVADLRRMAGADPETFHKVAHSLKSSASSVGAWQVVAHAQRILDMDQHGLPDCQTAMLRELHLSVDETVRHIGLILNDD